MAETVMMDLAIECRKGQGASSWIEVGVWVIRTHVAQQ